MLPGECECPGKCFQGIVIISENESGVNTTTFIMNPLNSLIGFVTGNINGFIHLLQVIFL